MKPVTPPTVVVVLVPTQIEDQAGVLTIERTDKAGQDNPDAFPGGFQEIGETWQQAAAREVLEETGITIDPNYLTLLEVVTVNSGENLIFCMSEIIAEYNPDFKDANGEIVRINNQIDPIELCYPSHTEMMDTFFTQIVAYDEEDDET